MNRLLIFSTLLILKSKQDTLIKRLCSLYIWVFFKYYFNPLIVRYIGNDNYEYLIIFYVEIHNIKVKRKLKSR